MIRSHFISAWLSGGLYYLKSRQYVDAEAYNVKSVWLNFDQCVGLHEAADFPLIPFDKSREACWDYIEEACKIVQRPAGRPGRALADDEAEKVLAQLGPPPFASYSIYMMTVLDKGGGEERPIYLGQTNSKSHRFSGGHAAISKLHAPEYDNTVKRVYFGCVSAVNDDDNTFPVEWINPLDVRGSILSSVEYQLIYDLKPELNTAGKGKCLVQNPLSIVIQNTAGRLLDGHSFGPEVTHDD